MKKKIILIQATKEFTAERKEELEKELSKKIKTRVTIIPSYLDLATARIIESENE